METGEALRRIRDGRQYEQDGYESWDDYLQKRWGMQSRQALRYISAADVTKNLDGPDSEPDGKKPPKPKRESVAREVAAASSNPEVQREVWKEATKETDEPTAKQVKAAAARVAEKKPSAKKGTTTVVGVDSKALEKQFGAIARDIDDLARVHGVQNSHEHRLATRTLGAALEAFVAFANNINAVLKQRGK